MEEEAEKLNYVDRVEWTISGDDTANPAHNQRRVIVRDRHRGIATTADIEVLRGSEGVRGSDSIDPTFHLGGTSVDAADAFGSSVDATDSVGEESNEAVNNMWTSSLYDYGCQPPGHVERYIDRSEETITIPDDEVYRVKEEVTFKRKDGVSFQTISMNSDMIAGRSSSSDIDEIVMDTVAVALQDDDDDADDLNTASTHFDNTANTELMSDTQRTEYERDADVSHSQHSIEKYSIVQDITDPVPITDVVLGTVATVLENDDNVEDLRAGEKDLLQPASSVSEVKGEGQETNVGLEAELAFTKVSTETSHLESQVSVTETLKDTAIGAAAVVLEDDDHVDNFQDLRKHLKEEDLLKPASVPDFADVSEGKEEDQETKVGLEAELAFTKVSTTTDVVGSEGSVTETLKDTAMGAVAVALEDDDNVDDLREKKEGHEQLSSHDSILHKTNVLEPVKNTQPTEWTEQNAQTFPESEIEILRYADRWERTIDSSGLEGAIGQETVIFRRSNIGVVDCGGSDSKFDAESPVVIHDKNDHKVSELEEDENVDETDLYETDEETESEYAGGVEIIRKIERSFSIDEDGRKSQFTDRLLERRKTIEVDKDDLSGIEARHTATLDITIGEERGKRESSQVSEINVVWGKTIDADEASSTQEGEGSVRNETDSNMSHNVSLDDSTDYWSADMSSDTYKTSDFDDTFLDTGDSMYASDSNSSFLERSEAFLDIFDSRESSLEPKFITVLKGGEHGEFTEVTGVFSRSVSRESDTVERQNQVGVVTTELVINREKCIDLEPSGNRSKTASVSTNEESGTERTVDKTELFRISDDIVKLGCDSEKVETRKVLRRPEDETNEASENIVGEEDGTVHRDRKNVPVDEVEEESPDQDIPCPFIDGIDVKDVTLPSGDENYNNNVTGDSKNIFLSYQEDTKDIQFEDEEGAESSAVMSLGDEISQLNSGGETVETNTSVILAEKDKIFQSQEDIRDIQSGQDVNLKMYDRDRLDQFSGLDSNVTHLPVFDTASKIDEHSDEPGSLGSKDNNTDNLTDVNPGNTADEEEWKETGTLKDSAKSVLETKGETGEKLETVSDWDVGHKESTEYEKLDVHLECREQESIFAGGRHEIMTAEEENLDIIKTEGNDSFSEPQSSASASLDVEDESSLLPSNSLDETASTVDTLSDNVIDSKTLNNSGSEVSATFTERSEEFLQVPVCSTKVTFVRTRDSDTVLPSDMQEDPEERYEPSPVALEDTPLVMQGSRNDSTLDMGTTPDEVFIPVKSKKKKKKKKKKDKREDEEQATYHDDDTSLVQNIDNNEFKVKGLPNIQSEAANELDRSHGPDSIKSVLDEENINETIPKEASMGTPDNIDDAALETEAFLGDDEGDFIPVKSKKKKKKKDHKHPEEIENIDNIPSQPSEDYLTDKREEEVVKLEEEDTVHMWKEDVSGKDGLEDEVVGLSKEEEAAKDEISLDDFTQEGNAFVEENLADDPEDVSKDTDAGSKENVRDGIVGMPKEINASDEDGLPGHHANGGTEETVIDKNKIEDETVDLIKDQENVLVDSDVCQSIINTRNTEDVDEQKASEDVEQKDEKVEGEEKSEEEVQYIETEEKSVEEIQNIKTEEESEVEVQDIEKKEKSEEEVHYVEKWEEEAQTIETGNKLTEEVQNVESEEKSEEDIQNIDTEEAWGEEAQNIETEEKSEDEVKNIEAEEKHQKEIIMTDHVEMSNDEGKKEKTEDAHQGIEKSVEEFKRSEENLSFGSSKDPTEEIQNPDAEEFISRLLDETHTNTLDGSEFLISDESDVLLNVSRNRRRILKPHRKFTKSQNEASENLEETKDNEVPPKVTHFADSASEELDTAADHSPQSIPGDSVTVSDAEVESKNKSKLLKRKRDGTRKQQEPTESEWSGDSGSLDASFQQEEDNGGDYDFDENLGGQEEIGDDNIDNRSTLSDELDQIHFEIHSDEDEKKFLEEAKVIEDSEFNTKSDIVDNNEEGDYGKSITNSEDTLKLATEDEDVYQGSREVISSLADDVLEESECEVKKSEDVSEQPTEQPGSEIERSESFIDEHNVDSFIFQRPVTSTGEDNVIILTSKTLDVADIKKEDVESGNTINESQDNDEQFVSVASETTISSDVPTGTKDDDQKDEIEPVRVAAAEEEEKPGSKKKGKKKKKKNKKKDERDAQGAGTSGEAGKPPGAAGKMSENRERDVTGEADESEKVTTENRDKDYIDSKDKVEMGKNNDSVDTGEDTTVFDEAGQENISSYVEEIENDESIAENIEAHDLVNNEDLAETEDHKEETVDFIPDSDILENKTMDHSEIVNRDTESIVTTEISDEKVVDIFPEDGEEQLHRTSEEVTELFDSDNISMNIERDSSTEMSTDRYEKLLTPTPPHTISMRLYEDILNNKARAEEVVAQNPELSQGRLIHDSSSSSLEQTLTPAGHLMSEMALLETAAREQTESLRLAVSEQEKNETEIRHLNAAISEAQQKLLASPVAATSVGALKQQIAEHNVTIASETRERSSSFGTPVTSVGRPLSKAHSGSPGRSLDVSWNTLQEQVHNKERELQASLQRQERYQHSVQELTAKMERTHIRLTQSPASIAAPLDSQMREYKETLAEIESIKENIAEVREKGEQLMDSPNSEGYKAMEATLTMLEDRFKNLQTMAEDKGRELQEAKKYKEKHTIAYKAYKKRVKDLQDWLEETKVRQASTALSSEDTATLQAKLDESKDVQGEINDHLRQVSDLALQCDTLCENEPPASAEKLRNELATLQNDLGQFKLVMIEKQAQLRAAIRESEKRRKEMEEHDSNVQKLQQWMTETKELTKASGSQATSYLPGQKDIHKELAGDIKKHRQLVRQISDRRLQTGPVPSRTNASDKEIRESWERLSRDLTQKKKNLETILRTKKPGELVKVSLHAPARHTDSARQLTEVKTIMGDMSECWNQLQTQLDEKQVQLDEVLTFQQQYQSALQNVSSWLDLAQQQLFTVPATTDEHIRQNENLQRQIRSLQAQVVTMSEQGEELLASTNSANKDLVEKCLSSLNDRVHLLEGTAQSQADDLRKAEREWKQYQDEVAELQRRLQDTQKLVLAPTSTYSLDQLMSNNQKIEAQLKKCETQLEELKMKESTLTQAYPKGVFPSELTTLQSNYMELHRRAMEKKGMLQKSVSVQEQYQKMLKDYAAFLDAGQDKLKSDSISARDLNHLKLQLSAHKDFFSDLEVHKAMLDSLASQCDPSTRAKYQPQHSSLSNLTHVLVDQASLHGQRLERLARQWTELDEKHVRLQKILTSIETQVPRPIVSGDSLTTIQDKLSKYKRLQAELADERNTVFEVVDKGKQILHSVNCPTLETAITDLADKWVSLNTDLTHELKKTETLGDQLSIFEAEAAVLSSWLSTAKMKLASFKQLSSSDLQNIGAIRTKVEKALEFRKEVENQLPLKNRVITVGSQLLQNKNYDTRGLSDRLNGYEEEWAKLEKGIMETEEFLHDAQMDLMPSRQALNELTAWIEEINKSLAKDAKKRVKTVGDIEVMVKKYKGYKIELASKQMTLDFVNQQVLAPQPEDKAIPHEKLDFADKLGELNKRWKKAVKDVNDRLNVLEGLQGKWEEYEKALERLQAWFHEQEDKIRRYKLIGHEVGVKQTLKDCKAMQQQLQAKQSDLTTIKTLGNHLIEISRESPGCQQSVKDGLSNLDQNWKRLEEQTRQLENLLTDMLGQWARYHTDLASLNQVLTQTEYALNHYTLIGGDIATLSSQVTKLQNLQMDLRNNSSHLESFSALASQLRQVGEPPVQIEIQKTVADLQTKWKQVSADLDARCKQFEKCLSQWQEYEKEYRKIRDWLDRKEALCTDLINMRDDPSNRPESLAKCKALQQDLDNVQAQVSNLYRMSDQLTKNMNPSTISIITSRQSDIEQRMLTLRQILAQHTSTLNEDLSMLKRFNEAFEVVKKFLTYAEAILAPEDPTKADEQAVLQSRLEQLQQLLLLFNTNYVKLDAVNDLGYRLALNESDATRLRHLNHQWQRLYEDANERSRKIQADLLVQQDFKSKCETWMTFLAQTEQDLAREIKGNLNDLTEQLCKCEQFESEMYSRQQILHAIISDGQKMMRAGEVEDEEEFQQKLHLLAEQWQSVSRRANQRRAIIEGIISQWQQFKSSSQRLKEWLQDKEDAMTAFEFDSDSIQVIRNLAEKVKTIQHEFKIQEAAFKKIHDLGNTLLQHADERAADEIKDILSDLQRRWYQVFSNLDDHKSRLEGVDRQWLECEDDIEDILNWLKETRRVLYSDIPGTYDELQIEINKCRDIAASFKNSEDKRQRLLAKEKQLSRLVQTEDMNLLHQRIRLLNKQWEELQNQTLIREQRLTEALFRWTNLGERIRSLMEWIENMETKVLSNSVLQVEELLFKLENEYKMEVEEKEMLKNEIVNQGKQLMKISSEIRASDIEQKILRLQDKWEHLIGVMDFRQRKLQETVLAVKQLDASMKNLSQWLSAVESELSGGLSYKDPSLRDIQNKLHETQELQQDIERHSAGVSAVLNLCEVLLHDSDACPTETEFTALQHAMKNLEKRWRNICNLSPQRRTRVEETWQLWEIFREDCKRFSDWLTQTEQNVREIDVQDVKVAKEEIKKYENLQRNVHDHLSDLEHINRQYRQLAKEGRTDTDGSLKVMMTELNNRWDALQLRVTEIMKRLRHSASIREDFETTRTSLITWLTEVDNQLTNLREATNLDTEARVLEIRRIEDEVHTKRHRMDYLDQAALYLMQKGDSHEALRVQQELDDFRAFSKRVLERVVTTQLYIERLVVAEVDLSTDFTDGREGDRYFETSADRIRELRDAQVTMTYDRQTAELEQYLEQSPPETPLVKRKSDASPSRVSLSPSRRTSSPIRRAGSPVERSQSPSPIRSRSPTRRSLSPTRVSISPTRRVSPSPSRSPSRFGRDVTDSGASPRHDIAQLEKSAKIDVLMEQLVESLDDCNVKLARLEKAMGPYGDSEQSMHLLLECEVAVDTVRRLEQLLKIETGFTTIESVDVQVKLVIQRWERLQKHAMEQNFGVSQERHDLAQFMNDIESMLKWLEEAEALQSTHRTLPTDIGQLDLVVRQYKDFLVQLESKKATVLSINLLSRNHLNNKTAETRQLRTKLKEMNRRWELVLSRATEIERNLQVSLHQNQGFHQTIDDYQLWLENIETKVRHCEPVNLSADETTLWEKYSTLMDIQSELQGNQAKVMTLKDTADRLLVTTDSPEMATARDKIHIINNRIRSVMHLTTAYISSLENKLHIAPKRGSASSSFDLSEGRSSGLGSSHASRSSTPHRSVPPSIRTRNRSPYAIFRQLFTRILRPLLGSSSQDRDNLSTDLEVTSADSEHVGGQVRPPLLMRVIRAALPIQLLLLLLFLLAFLIPVCEDDYSCLLSNNLQHSLSPMLRYTDGAPPI